MKRYTIEVIVNIYHVYDSHQDIFVNRFGYVFDDGFLSMTEAMLIIDLLESK
jgi:hypothetical protein